MYTYTCVCIYVYVYMCMYIYIYIEVWAASSSGIRFFINRGPSDSLPPRDSDAVEGRYEVGLGSA